jgi:hypothetical protein
LSQLGPMLTFQSMNALRQGTSSENLATLAIKLTGVEFAQSIPRAHTQQ